MASGIPQLPQGAEMADAKGLDPTYLQDLAESGGTALVRDVVETFLGTVPPRLATLKTAVERGDHEAANRAAHSIVSSAAMVGLTEVQATAREIELLTAQGGPVGGQRLAALERALAQAAALLEAGAQAALAGRRDA
jgi:HPt (histidine-containing phosphotransfer) domain-containing protein